MCDKLFSCLSLLHRLSFGCGLLLLACAGYATPPVEFKVPPTFPVGGSPWQVVSADVNADGIADLATANFGDGSVSVLLGEGNTMYAPARTFSAGPGANAVAIADLNGDGHADIVTANANGWNKPGSVSVLLGSGNGNFAAANNLTVGRGPRGIVIADFNADTHLDIATAISGGWTETNQVNILFGRGDGTFDAPASFTVGRSPEWIASGDFNGDGHPDLVTVNTGPAPNGNTASVLLNNGNGTFAPAATYTIGTYPGCVIVADLNGDTRADIATANRSNPSVSVLIGRGDGTFNAASTLPCSAGAQRLSSADFNQDGRMDLAVQGGGYESGIVTLFLGTGGGAFGGPLTYQIGTALQGITATEANQDGQPDLAVSTGYDSTVLLMRGNGDGTFSDVTDSYALPSPVQAMISGEFNRDGQPDLAVVNTQGDVISILIQETNGVFYPATNYVVGSQPHAIKAGDFNNDGRLDLVTANFDGTLTLLRGRSTAPGVFTTNWTSGASGTLHLGSEHTDVAVGKFNADANLDLVTANYYQASLSVAYGNGDGSFQTGTTLTVNGGPTCVIVEDFTGDGLADIAVGYEGGWYVSVLAGNGDGSFQPKVDVTTWEIPWSIASGDFNGDGKADLVTANYDWRQINVLINSTEGATPSFGPALAHELPNDPVSVAVGDFNGDNLLDIASGNFGCVSILLGYGDGTFSTATNYWVGGAHVAVADLNGDAMPDFTLDLGSKVGIFWNETLPRLQITPVGENVRLAWPAWKGYQLETASTLTSTTTWEPATDLQPVIIGSQYVVTNAPAGDSQIYRLKRP